MATQIHPTAIIGPGAEIGVDCIIGPYCTISSGAKIGDRTSLQSHVVVDGNTSIGADCKIFPFASIGTQSQDLKFKPGNVCYTEVGHNTIIREYVTIHAGTDHGTKTSIGNHCALLALSHVGHNCIVGDHVVLSHSATLGGHVVVGEHANLGGLCAVHQFCHIGRNAMVAGMARLVQHILPFTIAEGAPAKMRTINKVSMERTGFDPEEVKIAQACYKIMFMRELIFEDALAEIKKTYPDSGVAREIIGFVDILNNSEETISKRGIARK